MTIRLTRASAEIIEPESGMNKLKRIEYYGRISHRSEDRITEDSFLRFIQSVVMNHGDLSIIEHEKVTCEIVVDRGITHELVRHRVGSYTQESTRFVNYDKPEHQPAFIKPSDLLGMNETRLWEDSIRQACLTYRGLLALGYSPQWARSVLPNALASKIIVTYNLRSWRHFFIMRTTKETHPQMKEISIPLLYQFQGYIPILFDDITPETKQSESMRLLR